MLILPAVDKAPRNGERVKPFQIQSVQVHLVRLRGQLLPQRAGPWLWRILDEIVTPEFPWDQHCVDRTLPSQIIEQTHVLRWQFIENAMAVLDNKGIQKDGPLDQSGDVFRYLLYYRTAKAMPHQNNFSQHLPLNVRHDAADAIVM